jgi:hypothetical protein
MMKTWMLVQVYPVSEDDVETLGVIVRCANFVCLSSLRTSLNMSVVWEAHDNVVVRVVTLNARKDTILYGTAVSGALVVRVALGVEEHRWL